VTRLLLASGVRDAICCDRAGAIHVGRTEHMTAAKEDLARVSNREHVAGTLEQVLAGREVFVGLSSPGLVTPDMVSSMAPPRFVFALANPDPEILPALAVAAGAGVAVDGRVVNNALAFPGIVRGALDAGAAAITEEMKVAAATAIAGAAPAGVLLPSILDTEVHRAVGRAVADAWRAT
jgi:malate dehydrogenase (oxaloacetate-decarboxylating)